MQINNIASSSISSTSLGSTNSTRYVKIKQDDTSINNSADFFLQLVGIAGQSPEVRPEVVSAFQNRIESGEYPSAEDLNQLTDIIGAKLVS